MAISQEVTVDPLWHPLVASNSQVSHNIRGGGTWDIWSSRCFTFSQSNTMVINGDTMLSRSPVGKMEDEIRNYKTEKNIGIVFLSIIRSWLSGGRSMRSPSLSLSLPLKSQDL